MELNTVHAEPCYFYDGFVVERDYVILVSKLERWRYDDYFHGRIFFFDNGEWIRHDVDWQIESACLSPAGTLNQKRTYWYLGLHSGLVQLYEGGGMHVVDEQLQPGADVDSMRQIVFVGNTLFACGHQSRIYKRDQHGWVSFNNNLPGQNAAADFTQKVQSAKQPIPQTEADYATHATTLFGAMQTFFAELCNLNSIAGFNENDLYVVGERGFVAHYTPANQWQVVPIGTNSQLNWVECTAQGKVFICGDHGRLLVGNAAGFELIDSDIDDDFLCLNWFMGKLYIAGGSGLYVYDGENVHSLDIGLGEFEANRLDSRDGQLWSFGAKKISCFDGQTWRHFDHPDNV